MGVLDLYLYSEKRDPERLAQLLEMCAEAELLGSLRAALVAKRLVNRARSLEEARRAVSGWVNELQNLLEDAFRDPESSTSLLESAAGLVAISARRAEDASTQG